MRWLGFFKNKIFRIHLKLIFPHRDFIICIVSLAIFHPHFVIRNFPSAFYHPDFSIRHPPSAVIRSALYRDPNLKAMVTTEMSGVITRRTMFLFERLEKVYIPDEDSLEQRINIFHGQLYSIYRDNRKFRLPLQFFFR